MEASLDVQGAVVADYLSSDVQQVSRQALLAGVIR